MRENPHQLSGLTSILCSLKRTELDGDALCSFSIRNLKLSDEIQTEEWYIRKNEVSTYHRNMS